MVSPLPLAFQPDLPSLCFELSESLPLGKSRSTLTPVMTKTLSGGETLMSLAVSLNGLDHLFRQMGLGLTLTSSRPNYAIFGPSTTPLWPRSVVIYLAKKLRLMSRYFISLDGLATHHKSNRTSVEWNYPQWFRFPLIVLSWLFSKERIAVKMLLFSLLDSLPRIQNHLSRVFQYNSFMPVTIFIDYSLKQLQIARIQQSQLRVVKILIWLPISRALFERFRKIYKRCLIFHREIPNQGLDLQTNIYLNLKVCREYSAHRTSLMARATTLGPLVAPCSVKSSTAHGVILFSAVIFLDETAINKLCVRFLVCMPRNLLNSFIALPLYCVACLVPARLEAMDSSSTSSCLSTMTNLPLPGLSVVVSPIYHSPACGNVCYNPCLRATMELFSDYRYSPFIAFNLVVSLRMFLSPKPCTTFE
ncbi:unnamed protein product [Arabidopsis halleri]